MRERVTPLLFLLSLFATSVGTGALGAMLGLGGGTLLVPILTMFFGVKLAPCCWQGQMSPLASMWM
jgi:uncharacterized membrane protein YfcA